MPTENISRKERDRLIREEDFLSAAERLFAARGFFETSMEDVAREAEYATGTIYRYFPSKEELFHQMLLRKGRRYFETITAELQSDAPPQEKLLEVICSKVHFFRTNMEFLRIYMQHIAHDSPGNRCQPPEELKELHEQYVRQIRRVLGDGIAGGEFRTLDLDLTLGALTGITNELLMRVVDGENDTGEAELTAFISTFIEGGLMTGKGKRS